MKRKRKKLVNRIFGLSLAAVLAIQPMSAAVSPMSVVYAQEMTELVTNGNFSDVSPDGGSATNWEMRTEGESKSEFKDGKAIFNIVTMGADWSNYLKYTPGIDLVNGQDYEISFNVKSSVDRTVQFGFDGARIGIKTQDVVAGVDTHVSYTFTSAVDYAANPYMFYMGNIDGVVNPTEEHTVEITDFSIKSSSGTTEPEGEAGAESGTGGTGGSGAGAESGTGLTEDGEAVAAVEGNLLLNGNFESKGANWDSNNSNADVYFNKYRTVFAINGEAADWGQGLFQYVNLESGPEYQVSMDVETTVERTITVDINDAGREFTSALIPANTKTTISYKTSDVNNGQNKFYIYLGGVTGLANHQVVISNVSIVECPADLPDTKNDEAPLALTSLKGINTDDAIALKDGCFTAGLNNWETWCVDWMQTWNVVKYTPVKNGMSVYITNVGDGAGNVAWDAQLNQRIDLKKDLKYTISFDVHTQKARAFNVVINELGTGDFVKPIGLQKNETRHVVLNIPVQSEDALNKLFSIQMGKVTGEVCENTLTFTNMKIEVNGCGALAERVTDGCFTEGLGTFTADSTGDATVKADACSVEADIYTDTQPEDVTLTRGGIDLEDGVTYCLSFMAGATSGNREISVQLPDGTPVTFTLTDNATLYRTEFTPQTPINGGMIKFLLGGYKDNICIDTVYLNAKGYAEATGLKLDNHDIRALTKNIAPVISEDANAVEGEDVVLTYADADGSYSDAITGIRVNGIATDKYIVEKGRITLDKSLFTVSGERQTYRIEIEAYWYEKAEAIQIVYKTNIWNMTWSDEFNTSSLDMTKWSYQEGTGAEYGIEGWGNNEQQYYTRDNAKVENGTLVITATGDDRGGKPYSSSRIWTMKEDQSGAKFSQTYGRFEAKIKMPAGEGAQGLWPAFWLLPVDSPYGGWPVSGEIDIMEARGREGDRTDSTLHYGKTYPNEAAEGKSYVWEDDDLAITDYHIYSVDWTPTYMSFQVDGEEFYRASNWYCQGADEPQKYAFPAPFDQDFYIILNLAVGGMYDGNRNPSESALPAEMKVDYVRVYESATPVDDDYIAPEPAMDKDKVGADAKTELVDGDFTDVKKVVNDSDEKNIDGWNLLTLAAYGGAASFDTTDIDGDTFAKVNITNTGTANYSVQLTQKLSLYKGHWYTLSFDAKADTARDIITKLGGDGTNSWSTYFATTTKLTGDVKHYEYTFRMLNESDPSSRLEMNMGFGTATNVYIGNVLFREVDGFTVDNDMAKEPLEDGNHIYNGNFSLGDSSRMAYWNSTSAAAKVVKKGTEYVFRSTTGSELFQKGLELLQSDTYNLTFDAKANEACEIEITFADTKGKVYARKKINVSASTEKKDMTFTMPEGITDKNAIITFSFENEGVEVDNIVLTRKTYNNVNYSGKNCYPLTNGDFELGTTGWSTYMNSLIIKEESGNHYGQVDGVTGANLWDSMLIYGDLDVTGGYDYEFSFDIRADKASDIEVTMEDGSYTRYFSKSNVAAGTEWTHYTYDIRFPADLNLALKFLVAGAKEAFKLDIDNVVLKMKGAPKQAGSFIPDSYNVLGQDTVMTHSGTNEWADVATIMIDQKAVPSDKYAFNGSKLTIDSSLFTESREYTISATADGYADSTPATFRLYPANGDLICNGNMDYANTAWNHYIHGNNSATLRFNKGYLAATYHHAEGDEWGNPAVPWSIQWNQNITVRDAGSYDISFVAFSEIERYIMISVAGTSFKVKLTTEPEVHTVSVNIPSAGAYELQFQMGTVDPNADNGYFPADGFVDFEEHNFYLDSISMLPAGTSDDKSDSELYSPIIPDEDTDEGKTDEGKTDEDNQGSQGSNGSQGSQGVSGSQGSNGNAAGATGVSGSRAVNNQTGEPQSDNGSNETAAASANKAETGAETGAEIGAETESETGAEAESQNGAVDIPDEEVPMTSLHEEHAMGNIVSLWMILIVAAGLGAALVTVYFIKKRKNE